MKKLKCGIILVALLFLTFKINIAFSASYTIPVNFHTENQSMWESWSSS